MSGKCQLYIIYNRSTARWGLIHSSSQIRSAESMREVLKSSCWTLSECMYQDSGLFSCEVMLPKVNFNLFALSGTTIQDDHPKINSIWPDSSQVSIPELSNISNYPPDSRFDFSAIVISSFFALSDPKTQDGYSKINRHLI